MGLPEFIALHPSSQPVYNVNRPPTAAQCVDLVEAWCDFLGIERFGGNAADFQFDSHPDCDWIANTPTNVPLQGDIVVWRSNPGSLPGHVAIFHHGDANGFTSFDQNWPENSFPHLQAHTYVFVAGWLHPRPKVAPAPVLIGPPDPNLFPSVIPPPPETPEQAQDRIGRDLVFRVGELERMRVVDVGFINDLVAQVGRLQPGPAPAGGAFLRATKGSDPRGTLYYLTLFDQDGKALIDFVRNNSSDWVTGDHGIIRVDDQGNVIISPLGGHSLILGGDNGDGNLGNSSFFQRGTVVATSSGPTKVTLPYPMADANYRVLVTPNVHDVLKAPDHFEMVLDTVATYDWLVIRG